MSQYFKVKRRARSFYVRMPDMPPAVSSGDRTIPQTITTHQVRIGMAHVWTYRVGIRNGKGIPLHHDTHNALRRRNSPPSKTSANAAHTMHPVQKDVVWKK